MTFQPGKIKKEHVLKAFEDIDNQTVQIKPSTKFDVIYNGKSYPPKEVMRLAHKHVSGEYLWGLSGGEPTNKYLRALGFKIGNKRDTIKNTSFDMKEEFVKWLIDNPKVNYYDNNPEKLEKELDRYNDFFELDIYDSNKLKEIKSFLNEELYVKKTSPFLEFSEKTSRHLPRAVLGKNNYFKFLKEKHELKAVNYWVFQGNPIIYDVYSALKDNAVKTWNVKVHKDKIKIGDKVILWVTGKQSGCYALAEVESDIYSGNEFETERKYYTEESKKYYPEEETNEESDIVRLKITNNLFNMPLSWDDLKDQPAFKDFKGGNQGTNFTATKEEYDTILTLLEFDDKAIKTTSKQKAMNANKTLNKILYGPPGTGKTYNTVNEALKIVDPEFYNKNKENRKGLNSHFRELLIKDFENTKGQIAFCTFHQSFSYEDFVEGIKPKTNDKKEIYYEIDEGIFKKICQLADSSISAIKMKKEGKLSWDEEKLKNASFYKLSLGDSKKTEDKEIYEYCRDNNYIALGFGKDHDFTGLSETEIKGFCDDKDELTDTDAQQLNYFIHYLKVGNYVLISNGNKFVRALGRVIGEYEFDANAPIRYNQFRKVEWIFKDENIPIEELYNRGLSQQTLYKIDKDGLKKDFFVNHGQNAQSEMKKVKDYVLIIDEINRGNVSSIFGELITLIEPDKRAGEKEELEVTLPYSKEPFKAPHNVYIVGTMNTADRSIEALDTALRRRFSFKEMPPKPELIETEGNSGKINGIADGINLKSLLQTINNRIEKLIDKDHKIGHSYFLKVNNKESLIHCFENEVIPLLEEYFFGDYGKIGLVLGDSFVVKDETEVFEFAEFEGYDADVSSDLKERSVYKIRPSKEWDFNSI